MKLHHCKIKIGLSSIIIRVSSKLLIETKKLKFVNMKAMALQRPSNIDLQKLLKNLDYLNPLYIKQIKKDYLKPF
jgi:hypothetical protein